MYLSFKNFFALIMLCPILSFSTEVSCVKAQDLVEVHRADIAAKYIYAKLRDWRANTQFGREIYCKHLMVPNDFVHNYCLKNFNNILDSVKNRGFDPKLSLVLVDEKGRILDGAHRVAACALYDKEVCCYPSNGYIRNFNFNYFKSNGLEQKYLDAMAIQYCELKKNIYLFVLFPVAEGRDNEVEAIFDQFGQVVYKKELFLTTEGGFYLILEIYDGNSSMKDRNYARRKADWCFSENVIKRNPLRAYLFECESLEKVKECKRCIREIYGIAHNSVHSTDNSQETLQLAQVVFNKNSVHLLNHKKGGDFENFNNLLSQHKKHLKESSKVNDWFIISDDAVLSAYGIKDCTDLAFLCFDSPTVFENNDYDCHKDDLLFDPDHYFYYRGVKFCSLDAVKKMKIKRNQAQDREDVDLIDSILK